MNYARVTRQHKESVRKVTKWLVLAAATCIGLSLLWPRVVEGDYVAETVPVGVVSPQEVKDPIPPLNRTTEPVAKPRYVAKQANYPQNEVSALVTKIALSKGYTEGQVEALLSLMWRESGLRPTAQNPHSSAYGLLQFLDSTWAGTGYEKTSDPTLQTEAGIIYIERRYGDPITANNYQLTNGYY